MKFIALNDTPFIIKFGYFKGVRTTVVECVIYENIPDKIMYKDPICESLVKYPEDKRFVRDTARRIALKKALKHMPEDFRMEAWNSYFLDTKVVHLKSKKTKIK